MGKCCRACSLGETADAVQTYVDVRGEKFSLPAGSIEKRTPQARSLMPDGLERLLTVQEFRDLLAYLKPADPQAETKP